MGSVFRTFGQEQVTQGSHLEKLCLIGDRVGRDNISDFTINLIDRTEMWASDRYELPALGNDFVLLTPEDMLTRDETWINRRDLVNDASPRHA